MLFNLLGDAFDAKNGVIRGVVPELVEGGLSHLQYADDIVLLLENSKQNIAMTKFLLICYEELSGMKINYNKSEVFVVGIDELEGERLQMPLIVSLVSGL